MSQAYRKAPPSLAADRDVRQFRAVNAARAAFGTSEAVLAFLDTPHPALGARPIDLALASDEGLDAVEAAIAEQAERLCLAAVAA